MKKSVTTLMSRDQNDLQRIWKEIVEKVAKLVQRLGMTLESI